jgi:hypothetical protein
LGAFAAALATYRTVRELALQREASYLPDLHCRRQYLYGYQVEDSYAGRFQWFADRLEPGVSVAQC